jgi:LPXTG-motif cell wall-anchored protein
MFPSSFGGVFMIVGAIWVVQGLGIVPTGSFMDGEPVWAVLGGLAFVAGLIALIVQRRKKDVDQPGS